MATDPTAARVEREFAHGSPIVGCRFDPSGRFLFTAGEDFAVRRHDLLTGRAVTFAGHQSWVRGLAFVPKGKPDPAAVVAAEKAARGLPAVAGAAATPDPKPAPFTLLTADYHGKLVWWDGAADSPKPLRTVAAHDGWARAVAVSPDGTTAATCGNDHLVKLWSVADGKLLHTLTGHASHVYNVAFHPGGGRLASCDHKGVVKDWDAKTGACVRDFDAKILNKYDTTFMADIGGARGMAFDPATGKLAVCGITNVSNAFAGVGNPLVVLFDWKDGKATQLKPKDAFQGTGWGVAFHPAGYVVAAGGGSGGRVWFWKGEEPTSMHMITTPANARDLALSPSGERFAVGTSKGSAVVYTLVPGAAPPPPPAKAKK